MSSKSIYEPIVMQLEELVQDLGNEFQGPIPVQHGNYFLYRHDPKVRSDILAQYLKMVRIVSLLNAALCLIKKGFVQEVYILCRSIDEAVEDIKFFALKQGETGTSDKQIRLLKEFYQEQLSDPTDPLSSVPRDRVSRKDIRAAISNISIETGDSHTRRVVTKSLYEIFSGFVHGAYVHIMEMYGGKPAKYHMRGMTNSPYEADCKDNFSNHLYRSIMAIQAIASRVGRKDIILRSMKLGCELAELTECLDDEGIQGLKDMISRISHVEVA